MHRILLHFVDSIEILMKKKTKTCFFFCVVVCVGLWWCVHFSFGLEFMDL